MSKQNLLVFHPALAPYRVDFFNQLNSNFNTQFYFHYQNGPKHKYDQEKLLSELDFKPHYLSLSLNIAGRFIKTGVFSKIYNFNPDIILVSEFGQVPFLVCLYRSLYNRSFKIYTISDDSLDNAKSRKGLRKLARLYISKNVDGIIFPSKKVSKWFSEKVTSNTKTFELPIIHDDQKFRKKIRKSIKVANEKIKQYKLSGKKVILYVGRLAEEKNISFLLKVFSEIRSENNVLVIVGNGPLIHNLKNQIYSLGVEDEVILTGRKEGKELYAWYAIGQVFVLPSTYEPFGAVVNEALLAGCVVLVSEIAGASTLIKNNNGELFDPYNQEELQKKLLKCLEKINVIDESGIQDIKENKMPFKYKKKVKDVIENL